MIVDSSPWLEKPIVSWRDGEDYWLCGGDLAEYIDIPSEAERIRVVVHDRPSVHRHEFSVAGDNFVVIGDSPVFCYYCFSRFASSCQEKLKALPNATPFDAMYAEVEWE